MKPKNFILITLSVAIVSVGNGCFTQSEPPAAVENAYEGQKNAPAKELLEQIQARDKEIQMERQMLEIDSPGAEYVSEVPANGYKKINGRWFFIEPIASDTN